MRATLKVKARAKLTRVERLSVDVFKVWVKEAPENGKANEAVIVALSEYLDIPRTRIKILLGHTRTTKIAEIA